MKFKTHSAKLINLKTIVDHRGNLSVVESINAIGFSFSFVYWFKVNSKVQVQFSNVSHCEKEMLIISLSGNCHLDLVATPSTNSYKLTEPREGLYLRGEDTIVDIDAKESTVLLVSSFNVFIQKL